MVRTTFPSGDDLYGLILSWMFFFLFNAYLSLGMTISSYPEFEFIACFLQRSSHDFPAKFWSPGEARGWSCAADGRRGIHWWSGEFLRNYPFHEGFLVGKSGNHPWILVHPLVTWELFYSLSCWEIIRMNFGQSVSLSLLATFGLFQPVAVHESHPVLFLWIESTNQP